LFPGTVRITHGLAGTGFILAGNHLIVTIISMQTVHTGIRIKASAEKIPNPLVIIAALPVRSETPYMTGRPG
jgi:hypothetical protein